VQLAEETGKLLDGESSLCGREEGTPGGETGLDDRHGAGLGMTSNPQENVGDEA
jgi:hypothetical protein